MPQEYKIYRNQIDCNPKQWNWIFADDFEHAQKLFAKMVDKYLWNQKEYAQWLEKRYTRKITGWYVNERLILSKKQIENGIQAFQEKNFIYQLENN